MPTARSHLVEHLRRATSAMTDHLAALVNVESPSDDLAAVSAVVHATAAIGAELLGAPPEIVTSDGRPHLRWQFGAAPRVVLVGHLDTVWPLGTLVRRPFSVADGVARGPGTFDMKAGAVQAFHALGALDDLDGVAVVLSTDEETGSQTSRNLIVDTARGAAAALVLEPSAGADGALKTARKGVANFDVRVRGRAAHAGLEPEKGINALVELAHQIVAIDAIGDTARGTTVTVTVAGAGSATNVVPEDAWVAIDVRTPSSEEHERVDRALRALRAVVPGSEVIIDAGPARPPMPASASSALYEHACRVARELGLPPPPGIEVGGGSDGNFTAAAGVRTLDGLGAVGGGAHAEDEHVIVASMPERAALLAALVDDIAQGRFS